MRILKWIGIAVGATVAVPISLVAVIIVGPALHIIASSLGWGDWFE